MIRIQYLALLLLPLPLQAEPVRDMRAPDPRSAGLAAPDLGATLRDLSGVREAVALPRPAPLQDGLSDAPVSQSDVLRAELRPGWREADGRYMAALHLSMAPHWKTYWRAPGDAGIPPEFDWSGSLNLDKVTIHWPRPEVFDYQGMQTIGYLQEVILPVEITPQDPAQPVALQVEVELGVCNDICMPASLMLHEPLPAQGALDPAISAALAQRPMTADEAGVTRLSCAVEDIEDGLRITAQLDMPRLSGTETVVMEPAGGVWVSDTRVGRVGDALTAVADIVPPRDGTYMFDPSALRLTVLAEGRAVEMTGCPLN